MEIQPETGVERYARRLAEYLPQVAPDLEVTLFIRHDSPAPVVHPSASLVQVRSRLPRPVWREAALPRELKRRGIGLLHAPVAAVPLKSWLTRIATIHDVPPSSGSGSQGFFSRNRLRLLHTAAAAHALIVPSLATKEALLEVAPHVGSRVRVISHGVDPDFRPEGVGLNRERYGIPEGPFLLWVGTIRRRKDPFVLVNALARILKDSDRSLSLVMCGDVRLDREELFAPLKEAGLGHRMVLPGYVYREDLPDLYREAELVVVPSRLEGFGMCALEAMACGKPLVISRDAALVELAKGAARTFATGDAADLANCITNLLDDRELRRSIAAAAVKRASRFSWEGSARAHAELYRDLLRSREGHSPS
jgi:glycosyltransferase involved in cell wall biosynthesis